MGYYIHYGKELQKTEFPERTEGSTFAKVLCALFVACIIFCTLAFGLNVSYPMYPGDPDVTREAAMQMVSDIRNGAALKDAFFDFSLVIIENGKS